MSVNDPRFRDVWWIHEPRDWDWRRDPPHVVATVPILQQSNQRIRDDSTALNTDGGWLAAEDANYDGIVPDTTYRVRGTIGDTNGKNGTFITDGESLVYRRNGGTWTALGDGNCDLALSNNITGTGTCSVELLAGGGPGSGGFASTGPAWESGSSPPAAVYAKSEYFEYEFAFEIPSSGAFADNDTVEFRFTGGRMDADTNDTIIVITLDKSTTQPVWDQDSFRVGNDDGSESAYNFKRPVNTNWTQRVDARHLIRFLVQETAGANASPTLTLQLQYNKNAGGWNNVTGASSNVRAEASTNLTEGGDTTQRIGAGTFLTNNNWVDDNDGLTAASGGFAGNDEAEAVFSIYVVAADVADDDSIQLRVIESPSTPLDTYTNTPTLTVTKQTEEPNDQLTLTENLQRDVANTRDLSDSLTLTENLSRDAVNVRTLLDNLTLTDSITKSVTKLYEAGRFVRRLFWR